MINIGFIGAGARAQVHMGHIREDGRAEIVALCDVDDATVREAAEDHGARAYIDHEQMLEAETDLDAICVVLPPFAHGEPEVMAAERGLHLFVDKPIAISNDVASRIHEAIEANGVVSAVGYQTRYAETVDYATELIGGRMLGLIEGYYKSGVPGGPGHWWRSYEKSGGQVVEQATHIYDLVRFFGGEATEVMAIGGQNIVTDIDFEDVVSANIQLESGVVGHVTSTSASPRHHSGVEMIGEGLKLTISGNTVSGVVDGESIQMEGANDPTADAMRTFLEAVSTGDGSAIRSDYAEGRRSLALTMAVEESLKTGERTRPAY